MNSSEYAGDPYDVRTTAFGNQYNGTFPGGSLFKDQVDHFLFDDPKLHENDGYATTLWKNPIG